MDRQRVGSWLEGYRRAWERADTPSVVGLFTPDASYRSHPLRPARTGHDGVAAYWDRATADQGDVRVRFGDPIVDGDRVGVEWWTTMRAAGDPVTLVGCLLLHFAPDAHFRSEPFRDPHLGRDGVLAYTRDAYATEAGQDPRFGIPFASATGAAVEWWATALEEGRPATLIGASVLTFTPAGLVATARDYWFLEPGTHLPFDGWGR